MVEISLLEFLRTGEFGPIRLGMSRQEVLDLLGEPDNYSHPCMRLMEANIWMYDAIELHFLDEFPLWLICTDHLHAEPWENEAYPEWWGSERIKLDAWRFTGGIPPRKTELETGLREQNITYKYIEIRGTYKELTGTGRVILDSKVEIAIGNLMSYRMSETGEWKITTHKETAIAISMKKY